MTVERRWPGYRQDGEPARLRHEWQREEQIKADNLSARIRAADPVQRSRIDPATGWRFGEAIARGFYDDARSLRAVRAMAEQNRQDRERFRWAQVRVQGRAGRN